MLRRVDNATNGERTPIPPANAKGARGITPHLGTPYTRWILDRVRYHAIGRRWWRKAVQVLPTAKLYEMGLKHPYTLLKERTR